MIEPASTIITRFGGSGPLSRRLGLDRSAVHRWALPRHRGGSDGLVPAKYHQRLLTMATAEGIALTAADLVGMSPVTDTPPAARADDG